MYQTHEPVTQSSAERILESKRVEAERSEVEKQDFVCPECQRTIRGRSNFDQHIAKHTEKEQEPRADINLEKVKAALSVDPNLTPTELSHKLGIPRTTINSALDRLRKDAGMTLAQEQTA